jgi:hypothetical protein
MQNNKITKLSGIYTNIPQINKKKKVFPSFCFSYNPYGISSLSTYDKFIYITLIYFTKFYLMWNNWEVFGVRYQDRDGEYNVSIKHIEV